MVRKLFLIFLLALCLRVLFFSVAAVSSDGTLNGLIPRYDGYYDISENILAGNGFTQDETPPFIPDSIRTPLYPLFLASLVAIFKSYDVAIIVQIIIGSFIPLLGYRIATQLLTDRRLATIVAIILACEPHMIHLSSTIQVETFFAVLLLGGVTLLLDYWKEPTIRPLAFSVFFLGAATLARPTAQYLPILFIGAIFFLLRKDLARATRHSLLLILIFGLMLAPWLIRNYLQFGNPSLSVQSVSVPYAFLVPSTIALEEHIGFSQAQQDFNQGVGEITDVESITLENATEYKKRLLTLLLAHPVGLLKSISITTLTFLTHDGYLDILGRLQLDPTVRLERPAITLLLESPKEVITLAAALSKSPALLIVFGRILWILISLCFIIGALQFLNIPERRATGVFILLIVAYFILTTVAVGLSVNARFRMPVDALILTFAVYGASSLFLSIKTFVKKNASKEKLT